MAKDVPNPINFPNKNANNPSKEILVNPFVGEYLADDRQSNSSNTPRQLINRTNPVPASTTINPNSHSILPASGFYGTFQKAMASGAIPELLSSADWSENARGFPQQTFLGASIRSFTMQGGFGDSSSSLTVDLVVDEYNASDKTPAGYGDDVYHSGIIQVPDRTFRVGVKGSKTIGDNFVPPIPGSPVFFKFGPNFATVEEAYRKTFDDTYGTNTAVGRAQATGSTSMLNILKGRVTLPNNTYINLHLPDGSVPGDSLMSRQIVNYGPIVNGPARGINHIVFGGILQTYTQSRATNGNPLYTVNVIDPREILSNTTLILNNYSGPTYEQKNILNLYGFLEYNPTLRTEGMLESMMPFKNTLNKRVVTSGPDIGTILLNGDDKYYKLPPVNTDALELQIKNIQNTIARTKRNISSFRSSGNYVAANRLFASLNSQYLLLNSAQNNLKITKDRSKPSFPMTGTGFSRRSSQGIPYYRVRDAINALMEFDLPLPQEYKDQGFGGKINFRGFNYIVDFSGLPELPEYYYLDFDEINLLELALEICDVTNRDLFVSLLPIISHPACAVAYSHNNSLSTPPNELIAGIIRIDTIDRSEQPAYGSVKHYIDTIANDPVNPIYVENQDLGYELSNITTDKFIVGAQQVDMHYFSANADRDILAFKQTGVNGLFPNKPKGYQWTLEASLEQQVLPYYGKLGNNAVTIPKGFGAYQQILLDSSSLNAAGVGAYYVATEMELRCALISFDRWKEFLKMYNDTYMDSVELDDIADTSIAGSSPNPQGVRPPVNISETYAVTVPRSVFDTYARIPYGSDGLPSSPCNPPYGYPLYYKRMTKIGIPEGGLTDLFTRWTTLTTNLAELRGASRTEVQTVLNSQFTELRRSSNGQPLTAFEQQYLNEIERLLQNPNPVAIQNSIGTLENIVNGNGRNVFAVLPAIAKKNNQNALKVYNFVKSVAEECLGKKFLVKIPQEVNVYYENQITWNQGTQEYKTGPFGFKPRSTKNIAGYEFSAAFKSQYTRLRNSNVNMMQSFLSPAVQPNPEIFAGALHINYNPLSEKYESNYTPQNLGGYFEFDLYQNTLGASAIKDIYTRNFTKLPLGVQQMLIPQDLTNFINEDGRVSPYVRFDHSEDLTLEGLNDSDFTQQFAVGNAMIPDLSEALDNTGPSQFHSFPNTDENQNPAGNAPRPIQTAFVKCSVDEEIHLPPRLTVRKIPVHGVSVKDIGTVTPPRKIYVPCSGVSGGKFVSGSGVWVDSYPYYKANFVPLPNPGGAPNVLDFERYNPFFNLPGGLNDSWYVNTEKDNLNTEHAYALITLPNRVVPNKDARYRDGHFQSINTERFKHLMTMDVVKGLPGFDSPGALSKPPVGNLVSPTQVRASINSKIQAWFAMKAATKSLNYGFPQQINSTMPSPVYPDLVALPLMSKDRCYGPWVSSQLDGQAYILKNIGGRVDFIKDENLSPWNYGGYKLMDEAGRLQAEFSNSLLLFSERGSFTIPTIPQGNSLCRELLNGGPLVTSINVDVSSGGARTTYQMDLYTASFGKLQKQKQEEISKISREKKKLISERNALIRKGLGKNQSKRNFGEEYAALSRGEMPNLSQLGLGMANTMTRIAATVDRQTTNEWSSALSGGGNFGSDSDSGSNNAGSFQSNQYNIMGSIQNDGMMGAIGQLFSDQFDAARSYYNSAASDITEIFTPASNGEHPIMSYRPNSRIPAQHHLLHIDDEEIVLDNGTIKHGDNL